MPHLNRDRLSGAPLHNPLQPSDDDVQVEDLRVGRLLAAERQELSGQHGRTIARLTNRLEVLAHRIVSGQSHRREVGRPCDHPEQIIEVVCHGAGEAADDFHFLSSHILLLETLCLRDVPQDPDDVRRHTLRVGDRRQGGRRCTRRSVFAGDHHFPHPGVPVAQGCQDVPEGPVTGGGPEHVNGVAQQCGSLVPQQPHEGLIDPTQGSVAVRNQNGVHGRIECRAVQSQVRLALALPLLLRVEVGGVADLRGHLFEQPARVLVEIRALARDIHGEDAGRSTAGRQWEGRRRGPAHVGDALLPQRMPLSDGRDGCQHRIRRVGSGRVDLRIKPIEEPNILAGRGHRDEPPRRAIHDAHPCHVETAALHGIFANPLRQGLEGVAFQYRGITAAQRVIQACPSCKSRLLQPALRDIRVRTDHAQRPSIVGPLDNAPER